MTKQRRSTLITEIMAHVRAAPGCWFDRLPPEARDELLAAREAYAAGEIEGKPHRVAAGLIVAAKQRGWKLPQEKAVVAWLQKSGD